MLSLEAIKQIVHHLASKNYERFNVNNDPTATCKRTATGINFVGDNYIPGSTRLLDRYRELIILLVQQHEKALTEYCKTINTFPQDIYFALRWLKTALLDLQALKELKGGVCQTFTHYIAMACFKHDQFFEIIKTSAVINLPQISFDPNRADLCQTFTHSSLEFAATASHVNLPQISFDLNLTDLQTHVFIVVNRLPGSDLNNITTWGPDAIVIDVYDNKVAPVSEILAAPAQYLLFQNEFRSRWPFEIYFSTSGLVGHLSTPPGSRKLPWSDAYSALLKEIVKNVDLITPDVCDECHIYRRSMGKCARCHSIYYCSRTCQEKAWENRHKYLCHLLGAT